MTFISFSYLIFFPLVSCAYFLIPHRFRWMLLLCASVVFYMSAVPAYILVLGAAIIIDYTAALLIERSQGRVRKVWLIVSILSTCSLLFVFKYYNFFLSSGFAVAHLLGTGFHPRFLTLALPIGLSFHTFQSLSYVIEVFYGTQKAEKHFGIYALYVMFFPQLVAGPIERPQQLLHQFREIHIFDDQRAADGLKRIAWGVCKKVIIADRLAKFVDPVFSHPTAYTGLPLVVATVLFAFQLYGDFSGYSDIAVGSASVMGFRLIENFNHPYRSRSIAEFWRRWHISLSSWLRDYIYFPLVRALPRPGRLWLSMCLVVTFLLSGLWHGAGWTYVMMGALHGGYLVIGFVTHGWRTRWQRMFGLTRWPRLQALFQEIWTFALVCIGWIFFRAAHLHDALYIVGHLFVFPRSRALAISPLMSIGLFRQQAVTILALIVILFMVERAEGEGTFVEIFRQQPAWLRRTGYAVLLAGLFYLGNFGATKQFIYFQF